MQEFNETLSLFNKTIKFLCINCLLTSAISLEISVQTLRITKSNNEIMFYLHI